MLEWWNGVKLNEFLPRISLYPCYIKSRDGMADDAENAFHSKKSNRLSWFVNRLVLITILTGTLCLASLQAQTPPSGFSTVVVTSGWDQAVGLTFNPDGSHLFVWQKNGSVWVVANNQKTLLLDISEEVGDWRDYGLLGFVLDPQFDVNGYFYLLYVVDYHHLMHFGTSSYSPTTNEYNKGTIARLTRYTARKTAGNYTVAPTSRKILLGATKSTGLLMLSTSHGVGSLVFGTDGTLLISCGDGAVINDSGDMGGIGYAPQALTDGILTPQEDVGSFRAQLVQSLSGKILRIDANTGEGIPSNPFYEPAKPGSNRSKVWALGFRNPFRFTLQPESGSHVAADGNPGVLYVGDVGLGTLEELNVVTRGGMNFGWPLYEGFSNHGTMNFVNTNTYNYYAPNPLYGVNGCTQQYFYFQNLFKEATASGTASFTNPCNTAQAIPASIPTFLHSRPTIDWNHAPAGPARTGIFRGQTPGVINIGAAGSPISGPQFRGNASMGGVFYTGNDFPAAYKNTYFHGDYGATWIKNLSVDATTHQPTAVRSFIDSGAVVVAMATNPVTGSLYYVNYGSEIRKVYFSANRPPVAVASVNKTYGIAPLTVQFTGSASVDPEGKPLRYEWNFGDGSPMSTQANPAHTFTARAGVPTKFTVTLEVEDDQDNSSQTTLIVSANNTPPQVTITSPADNSLYPLTEDTTYPLRATVTDQEQSSGQLSYQWQTVLHHNDHTHPEPIDTNRVSTTSLSPIGCDGQTYFYRISLTVTDAAGIFTTKEVNLYPDCSAVVNNVSNLSATAASQQVPLSWSNPATAFDEVMAVAKVDAPVTAVPWGDGSAYTANLNFTAAATAFDGGKVVYKGSTSPQTITGLTNNTPYFFKVFTRKGTIWSQGVGITATPIGQPTGQQVVSFTLVNADTDQDLQTLINGTSLNLTTLPTKNLNIRANCSTAGTTPAKVGSVVFNLSGQQIRNYTEGGMPYALFGDVNGNYNAWVPAVGSYSLKGTPFSAGGGTGTLGTALTINFTVIDQPATNQQQVVSFTLMNADTDLPLQTLSNGFTLNLAALPTKNLNIRAITSPAKVGSVVFNLSGQQVRNVTEGGVAYALFGDINGNYNAWVPTVGSYSLKATPFSAGGGTGTAGTPLALSFSVTNQAGARMATSEVSAEPAEHLQLWAQPNPFSRQLTLTFSSAIETPARLMLYDRQGREVSSLFEGTLRVGEAQQVEVEAGSLLEGIYLVRLVSGGQSAYRKVVLIR